MSAHHWRNHLDSSTAILIVAPVGVDNCFTVYFFSDLQHASQNLSRLCTDRMMLGTTAAYLWGFPCDYLIYEECIAVNNAVVWRNQLSHCADPRLYSHSKSKSVSTFLATYAGIDEV